MMKKIVLALLAMLAIVASSEAQSFSVKGKITDAKTGEALPFVNVGLMRTADTVFVRGASTDFDGSFTIVDVKPDVYLLQTSFVGYQSHYETLEVKKNVDKIEISLKPSAVTLGEVSIKTDKPLYVMDGEKNKYNVKEDPSIQTGTASDALQNAPGVEVDAEGNITLRGVSSVEIWINDRPSHMNEEALKQYIKQLPANAIERIEVITNPSARYSSSGGVINIVTNQKITRNELLCVGLRGSTLPSVSPWVSYVWANEKVDFNFYLNGNYSRHDGASDGKTTLFDANHDTSRYQEYNSESHMPYWGGYSGFNMNWNIDSTSHLSAWAGFYPYWDRNSYDNNYTYYEYVNGVRTYDLSYFDSVRNNGISYGGYAGLWYEKRFDTTGRKLTVSANGNYWRNYGYSNNWRDYNNPSFTDFRRHTDGDMYAPSGSVEVNYSHPMKNGIEIETGAEMGFGGNYNNEHVDSLLADNTWSNMAYQSYVAQGMYLGPAAYITGQKRWGGFTAKVGLRFEDDLLSGRVEHNSLNDRVIKDTSFIGWVPSIHLSYQTKTFESYSLSYTRRFSHSDNLLDYTLFCVYDDYSFRTGNPNLMMTYTHNLEAAFNKYVVGFGNIGLNAYFRANTNEIGTMTSDTVLPAVFLYPVNYSYPVNIGSSHTEGIEANITYRPTGFLNVRFNASLFNYAYNYNDFSDNKLSYSFRLNVWAKLWNQLELYANAHYTSPRLGLYSLTNANKGVDFGLSSDFFDRQLSVNLNVRDIFGWSEWGSNTTAPQYQTTGSQRFKSTFVGLGITWRIGKMELESKARQGSTESIGSPQR